MDIDPASLRTMRAIADAGTISGAAEALNTSQPAVSQQVRRLESRLGTSLLERQGRGVRLTEAGWVLAKHGIAICAAVSAAQEELESLAGLKTGRIRLAAFPSVSAGLVPYALAKIRAIHPGIQLSFMEAEPPEAMEALLKGQADVAISFDFDDQNSAHLDAVTNRGFITLSLLQDPMWLALPSNHRLVAKGDELTVSDLADQEWIAGCENCRSHLVRLADREGFQPHVAFATDDNAAAIGMVGAGLGVGLFPAMLLENLTLSGVSVSRCAPAINRRVHLVTTTDLARVPTVQATIETLKEAAAKIASTSTYGLQLA